MGMPRESDAIRRRSEERMGQVNWRLVAPDVDRLLSRFGDRWKNPTAQTPAVLTALDGLFEALADLQPLEDNEEAKAIWLRVPRGDLADFDDYDYLLDAGEVSSREEYASMWKGEYPDDVKWYELVVSDNGRCRTVSVGRTFVVCADLEEEPCEFDWDEEYAVALFGLLARAASQSVDLLREGAYNALVEEQLPYHHRTGIVRRSSLWEADASWREGVFEGMGDETFRAFREYAACGAEDEKSIGRLASMTGNDFLGACATGYEACGYDLCGEDGERLPLVDLYLRYADGRDEGLTSKGHGFCSGPGIDLSSPEAWDAWYFDRKRSGGHPWEVCRGGNSTHVDLFVSHDRRHDEFRHRLGELTDEQLEEAKKAWGYYFVVAGKAWSRSVEAVNIYVALKRAGLPVVLRDADAILARFEGTDYVGVVPHDVVPRYCESMFPGRYGTILDFIHVYGDDMESFGDEIEWLPARKARLAVSGSVGSPKSNCWDYPKKQMGISSISTGIF